MAAANRRSIIGLFRTLAVLLFLGGCGGGFDIVGQPGQALEKTLAGRGTARDDEPYLVLELVEFETLRDFFGIHGYWGRAFVVSAGDA